MAALPFDDADHSADQYAYVLGEYLRSKGEEPLYRASLLSRQFVERGFGPEELVGLHVQALEQHTRSMNRTERMRAEVDAHQVLVELMTAFGIHSREVLERRFGERTREAEHRTEEVRRQVRRALARSRQQEALAAERAAILGQIAEGVVVADPEGHITYVNDAAQQLFGEVVAGEPMVGRHQSFSLHTLAGDPYPAEEFLLSRAVQHGQTVTDERWRIRRADGTEIVAEGSASPVVLEDGTRYGSVLVLHDASAQHALEQEKDSFLSSVSHDLKNPLAAVIGTTQLLRRRLRSGPLVPSVAERQLATIESSAAQMVEQLDSILDVARTRMGRLLDLVRQPVDLVALVRKTVAAHEVASDHHHFRVAAGTQPVVGQWDGVRLRRVLNNLLGNAVRYSPDGGEIVVAVDSDGREATVAISDRGMGIPSEDLPFVFERFRRGSNVQGRIAGTGIGLADVAQVVEQHGGTVTVESQVGHGSTFSVRLPMNAMGTGAPTST